MEKKKNYNLEALNNKFLIKTHDILKDILPGPVTFKISNNARVHLPKLGYTNTMKGASQDISPNKKYIFFVHKINDFSEVDREVHLDVWDIKCLKMVKKIVFKDIVGQFPSNYDENKFLDNLQCACFIDNEHIALGLTNGFIRITSIFKEEIFLEKQIGGFISSISAANDILAVSIFPGNSEKYYIACGIKLYSVKEIIKNKNLNPIKIIPPEKLKILPNTIKLNKNATKLYCRGATIIKNGLINSIEVFNLKTKIKKILFLKQDKEQNHEISNISDNGDYIIVDKDNLLFYKNDVNIWRIKLNSEINENNNSPFISDDGKTGFLKSNDVLYKIFFNEKKLEKFKLNMGKVLRFSFASNKKILVKIENGKFYDIIVLDINTEEILKSLEKKGYIENIDFLRYDVSIGGDTYIGDSSGNIRVFDNNLVMKKHYKLNMGNIYKILSDPFNDRVALLTTSQCAMMFSINMESPKIIINGANNKPAEEGSGCKSIHFPLEKGSYEGSSVWLQYIYGYELHFDGHRFINCSSKKITINDYHCPHTYKIDEVYLDSNIIWLAELKGRAFVLLKNGELICFDPFNYKTSIDLKGNKILKKYGKHISKIIQIKNPIRISRIPKDHIALWSKDKMFLIYISDDFKGEVVKEKKISDVINVKYDKKNNRIILAHEYYFSFLDLELTEMFRLYLLKNGKNLIHVPYPEKIKTEETKMHPGYIYSEEECFEIFEILDKFNNVIHDKKQKNNFIKEYFNEFMVREAIKNYKKFVENLQGAFLKNEIKKMESLPKLIISINGNKNE